MKKKILYTSLSFLLPLTILLVIFKINGLLDDKTIISGDMQAQYYPLFNYLKEMFNGNNSIFYSFYKGLGGTMFGTFFYYLSSPLNLFLMFINKSNIPEFMTYLTVVKLSLCGLTMYIYMSHKFQKHDLIVLSFSLCYALMGYNLNYFINIMWLDVVFFTPLILLGIDKIIDNESPILYIITLFISILSNYYLSYMLCIFCVIYFIYEISLKNKTKQEKKQMSKKFIILSLLTGLMCSFFLVPCLLEMTTYARTIKFNEIFTFDYNYFDLFSKTYIGSLNLMDTLNYTSMNVYCSTIILPLVYLYLINRDIDKKERKLTLILLITMIIPCFIGPLNYLWHLFTLPNFYSYRYSYLLCLFMIIIAYKSITNMKISYKKILFYLTFYLIISLYFIIITRFSNYYSFLNYKLIWLSLLLLIIYFILLIKLKNKTIILILIAIELVINVEIVFKNSKLSESETLENYQIFQNKINKYKSQNRIDVTLKNNDDGFAAYSLNDSLFKNYRTSSTFLSTNNINNIKKLINIGLNEKYNKQNYFENSYHSKIYNALFGNEYIISSHEDYDYDLVEQIEFKDKYYIYKNNDYLSIGYIVQDKCNDINFEFPYDEKILNCLVQSNNKYYKEYKLEKEDNNILEYNIKNEGYYIIYKTKINEHITPKDILTPIDSIYYNPDYVLLQNNKKDNKLKIKLNEETKKEDIKIYYLDYENIKKDINKLKEEPLNYKIEDNKLKGSINTNGGTLLLTIPYEKGYTIEVNGKNAKYEKVLDSFIGINLEKGIHDITLEYEQPGIKTGLLLSVISIITTIIYLKKEKNQMKNNIYKKSRKC